MPNTWMIFLVVYAFGSCFQNLHASEPTDLTAGWKQVPLKFAVQKPWDLDVSKRYRFDPATGTYFLWVYKTDKAHEPPPNKTDPRTELGFKPGYKSGEHMFDADVYVVAGTHSCIMQIFGAAKSATTLMLYTETNGVITYGKTSTIIRTNANNTWWNLKVMHNANGGGEIKIYVDNKLVFTFPGKGERKDGGGFFFKCGVYGVKDRSEVRFRNIKIWQK